MPKHWRTPAGSFVVSSLVLLLLCVSAQAQTCHPTSLREPNHTGARLSVVQAFATFDDTSRGEYQAVITALGWDRDWLAAELAFPMYRLAQEGREAIGLGDLSVDVRVAVFRSKSGGLATGVELAASLPTGDEQRDLGMGHVMAMPGAWLRLLVESLSVMAQAGYGWAVGASAHSGAHDHTQDSPMRAIATPRVNPMNASELEHAVGLSYAVHANASVTARWLGAVALDSGGVTRQIIAPGLQLMADRLDAALEIQVPVTGDPFDSKVLVSIGTAL